MYFPVRLWWALLVEKQFKMLDLFNMELVLSGGQPVIFHCTVGRIQVVCSAFDWLFKYGSSLTQTVGGEWCAVAFQRPEK